MKKTRGTIFLLMAALVWGMAFVAQTSTADSIGSFTFNAVRSLLASAFLFAVIVIRKFINKTEKAKPQQHAPRRELLGGVLCGVVLCVAINFQQFGIAAYPENAAASGRAGFLTATYVVMVAIVALFAGKKMHPTVLLAVVGCIAGMYLLSLSNGISEIYLGDILVFIGAICLTVYIFIVDRFSQYDSLKLCCMQFLVCGVLSLLAMFLFETPDVDSLVSAWLPILYAGIMSSGIGYTLQMLGQKDVEPAVASIVMSLESVFAAISGWLVLGEHLQGKELIGCILVFASVILAQMPDFLERK